MIHRDISLNRSPLTTRRRVLSALGSCGAFVLGGCSTPTSGDRGDGTITDRTTFSPTESEKTSTATPTTTPTNSFDFEFTSTSGSELWDTPQGVPAYTDAEDWRCVAHDAGNTGHNPHANGPQTDPTVRWSFKRDGDYFDGWDLYHPLIVDDTVFVAFQQNEGERNGILAIDALSGNSQVLFETEARIWHPTIVSGKLYAALDGSVVAFSLEDGSKCWQTGQLMPWIASIRRIGEVVVATHDEYLHGIDAETGDILWNASGTEAWGQFVKYPVAADGTVVPFNENPLRDRRSGEPSGSLETPILYPVLRDGILYGMPDQGLAAINWETLEPNWQVNPRGETVQIYGGFPVVLDDIILVLERENNVAGRARTTGERLWSTELPSLLPIFRASDPQTAYFCCRGGTAVAIDPQNGEIKWSYQPPGAGSRGSGIALADDLLVIVDQSGTVTALE